MRISGIIRLALLASAAIASLPSITLTNALSQYEQRAHLADKAHDFRVLAATADQPEEAQESDTIPEPKKKKHKKKKKADVAADAETPAPTPEEDYFEYEAEEKSAAEAAAFEKAEMEEAQKLAAKEAAEAENATADAPKKKKKKGKTTTPAPDAEDARDETPDSDAPDAEDAVVTKAPASASDDDNVREDADDEVATKAPKKKKKKAKSDDDDSVPTNTVNDQKIKGDTNEGVIDGSSEGTAEIDKIDLRNEDGWVSVYDDPPLLVIKASLYAFISYNDSEICDTFNMTMNAVEQKAEDNGRFSYHVVAYINCTKDGTDETQGRFILNFIPEGKRLLLTECGHREEGEIVNWLRIEDEVPECMTPSQRKKFLAQPMKHIHATNGTIDTEATQTDFLSRLENYETEEVAVVGTATVALMAIIVVLLVFVIRKRKAQKDLERTIAGAKAEHAVEDDDLQTEGDEKPTKERKGLMDSAKAKSDDPDMEEGSFVNSPAVRV